MAVGFDAKMTAGNNDGGRVAQVAGTTSITSNGMTIGGSGTLLVATLCIATSAGASNIAMTWNGVSMTAGPTRQQAGLGVLNCAIFYLVNPITGNRALAASWTGSGDCYMSCVSFTGTDTSVGIVTADNQLTSNATGPGAISVTIPTESTGATLAAYAGDGDDPTVTTQTEVYSQAPLNPGGGASYAIGGTTSNVHTFTNGSGAARAVVGVHVIQVSGQAPLTANLSDVLIVGDRHFVID